MDKSTKLRLDSTKRMFRHRKDGGEGSGNWGHAGRPGKVGGSQENENAAKWFRYTDSKHGGYSSLAKEKKKAAKPHHVGKNEITRLPDASMIIDSGHIYLKQDEKTWEDKYTGKILKNKEMQSLIDKKDVKVAIPCGAAWYDHEMNEKMKKETESSGSMIGGHKTKKGSGHEEKPQFSAAQTTEDKPSLPSFSSYFMSSSKKKEEPKKEEGNAASTPKNEQPKSTVFNPEGYSKEQVEDAAHYNSLGASDVFSPISEKIYDKMSEEQFASLYKYTEGSHYLSEPLHGQDYYYALDPKALTNDINNITDAINKAEIPDDCVMYHAIGSGGFTTMFGSYGYSDDAFLEHMNGMVGVVVTDPCFTSCCASGYKKFEKEYFMDIFVPKGAKGLYVNDHTAYPGEDEVILQRGGFYKVTGAYLDENHKKHIKCELVGQDTSTKTAEDWEKHAFVHGK